MGKRVAIIQSNYIPWKGYFSIIKCVDEFVLLDDVQYTRRDWRNRNLIKTQTGLKWLTIPVDVKGRYLIDIKDVRTAGSEWRADHWTQIVEAYKKTPYFSFFAPLLQDIYLNEKEINLSLINYRFIILINEILNITTPIRWSMEFDSPKEKTERLVHICKSLDAVEYISGLAAKEYMDILKFEQNNIQVRWADYSNFPVYPQLYPPFEHSVSIIDLIFNEGPNAQAYLKQI
ncbi:MAG TPA: WbqC family protein [Mucilaginibacter sp.]|nr:WbqC family protein [Mucilaginibacter sp.]